MRKLALGTGVLLLYCAAAARPASAQTAGINMGAPVWNGEVAKEAVTAAAGTGAAHVRVNFRLDAWSSPGDPTKVKGKTFFEAYDEIIDAITSQGIEVYGLLNDELAPGLGTGPAFESAYATNVLAVVDRYKDRVRVWETINEPNDYAGGSSARFTPSAFANVHARVYDDVKRAHAGDACWDVKIVSGPLFSFDGVSAADYLDATIAAGRSGGRWKAIRDALGHDPIDDVGYHIYVAQGPDSPPSEVGASAGANLAAIRSVIDKYALGDKKVWISEIGYRLPLFDAAGQADRVDTMFAALGARSDVASIQWFTIADFGGEGWGLYGDSFAAKDRRPSYDRFVAQAKAHAPALAAKLEVTLPKTIEAGAAVIAKVKATNLGKSTWRASDDVRLGAASGCPAAWAVNALAWRPGAGEGYASSATDARRYLGASSAIAQGESVTIDVPLVAPAALGKQRFAARMVKEGVAWFGTTAIADVEIVPAAVPPGGGAGGGEGSNGGAGGPGGSSGPQGSSAGDRAASGCGCRTAGGDTGSAARGIAFALGVAIACISLRARRRL